MTELDDRLREHVSTVTLTPEALSRIHATALNHEQSVRRASVHSELTLLGKCRALPARLQDRLFSSEPHNKSRRAVRMWRFAALGALIVAVGLSMRSAGSIDERSNQAIREVAMNHATRLNFEFEGDSLAALDSDMNQLPFKLYEPSRLPPDTKVLGSRYCSLSGLLAAHVKLREGGTGRPLSLFVTRFAAALKRLDNESDYVDGVEVQLFHENGLFYALARQAG